MTTDDPIAPKAPRHTLLSGELLPFCDATHVLGYAIGQGLRGHLTLMREHEQVSLALYDGELVSIDNPSFVDTLITQVHADGRISASQEAEARAREFPSAQACIDFWLSTHVLREETAWDLLQSHHAEVFDAAFAWRDGSYTFRPQTPQGRPSAAPVGLARLFGQAVERHIDKARLDASLGRDTLYVAKLPDAQERVGDKEPGWDFIEGISAQQSVRVAAELAHVPMHTARQWVFCGLRLGRLCITVDMRASCLAEGFTDQPAQPAASLQTFAHALHALDAHADYFDILRVLPNASPIECHHAAAALSMRVPEGLSAMTPAQREDFINVVDDAHDVLVDGRRLQHYLAQGLRQKMGPRPTLSA